MEYLAIFTPWCASVLPRPHSYFQTPKQMPFFYSCLKCLMVSFCDFRSRTSLMPFLKKWRRKKQNFCQRITNNTKPPFNFFPPVGYVAPSLTSKALTFPGARVEGVCKSGFSSGPRCEVLRGLRRDPRTPAPRARAETPAAQSWSPEAWQAETTCLWRHLVAGRRATGLGEKPQPAPAPTAPWFFHPLNAKDSYLLFLRGISSLLTAG